jgi:hypothetical protein
VIGRYEFGEGMIHGPGEGFDRTHMNVPPTILGGVLPARPGSE